MSTLTDVELTQVRAQFPALTSNPDYIFAENAGGSQVLSSVASSISNYLLCNNVQMAHYPLAKRAESQVSLGTSAAAILLGAKDVEDVMIGQSATQLVFTLSLMIEARVLKDRKERREGAWKEGDEIVVSDADHETNRGAWTRLAERLGMKVVHWPVTPVHNGSGNKFAVTLDPEVLKGLVSDRTRLVAFTACSNLLGAFTDISGATKVVKQANPDAVVCVDCVAYAPHRRLQPREWGADVAFFSLYKTYGAHVGAMYVSPQLKTRNLSPLNHFFLQGHAGGMYPYQTSSVQYELNHSISAVGDYLNNLGLETLHDPERIDWNSVFNNNSTCEQPDLVQSNREQVDYALDAAFAKISAHEGVLMSILIPFLLDWADRGLRIVGPEEYDSGTRAPTVAFIVVDPTTGKHQVGTSKAIHTALVYEGKVGAQQGHMYAHKLVSSLGLDLEDGVVRLSFVHYNTAEEVQRVTEMLRKVFETVLS